MHAIRDKKKVLSLNLCLVFVIYPNVFHFESVGSYMLLLPLCRLLGCCGNVGTDYKEI